MTLALDGGVSGAGRTGELRAEEQTRRAELAEAENDRLRALLVAAGVLRAIVANSSRCVLLQFHPLGPRSEIDKV